MTSSQTTAALVIIGDEILSGRTQDTNTAHIAKALGGVGVALSEVRVVRDDETAIVAAVNALRDACTYVFTTGGIGPTHDDITSASVAAAFGRKLVRHPEAERRLAAYYADRPEELNAMRLRMAEMPEGVDALIDNPASAAPGYRIGNVHVLPGVPSIMRAMLDGVLPTLKGGPATLARAVTVFKGEGDMAEGLGAIQKRFPEVAIGSYPFMRRDRFGTSIVFRGVDRAAVDAAAEALITLASDMGAEFSEDVGAG